MCSISFLSSVNLFVISREVTPRPSKREEGVESFRVVLVYSETDSITSSYEGFFKLSDSSLINAERDKREY